MCVCVNAGVHVVVGGRMHADGACGDDIGMLGDYGACVGMYVYDDGGVCVYVTIRIIVGVVDGYAGGGVGVCVAGDVGVGVNVDDDAGMDEGSYVACMCYLHVDVDGIVYDNDSGDTACVCC